MKKILCYLFVFIASFAFGGLFSSSDSATGSTTIAVVDLAKIVESSEFSKTAQQELSDTFDARRESLMAEANEFKVAFEDFNRDKAVMDPAEAEKIQETLTKRSAELSSMQIAFEQEFYEAQNASFQTIFEKVKEVVNQVAQEKGYDLVLPSNQVLHFQASSDITDLVAALLDK